VAVVAYLDGGDDDPPAITKDQLIQFFMIAVPITAFLIVLIVLCPPGSAFKDKQPEDVNNKDKNVSSTIKHPYLMEVQLEKSEAKKSWIGIIDMMFENSGDPACFFDNCTDLAVADNDTIFSFAFDVRFPGYDKLGHFKFFCNKNTCALKRDDDFVSDNDNMSPVCIPGTSVIKACVSRGNKYILHCPNGTDGCAMDNITDTMDKISIRRDTTLDPYKTTTYGIYCNNEDCK
jgi:hypothetical protein